MVHEQCCQVMHGECWHFFRLFFLRRQGQGPCNGNVRGICMAFGREGRGEEGYINMHTYIYFYILGYSCYISLMDKVLPQVIVLNLIPIV